MLALLFSTLTALWAVACTNGEESDQELLAYAREMRTWFRELALLPDDEATKLERLEMIAPPDVMENAHQHLFETHGLYVEARFAEQAVSKRAQELYDATHSDGVVQGCNNLGLEPLSDDSVDACNAEAIAEEDFRSAEEDWQAALINACELDSALVLGFVAVEDCIDKQAGHQDIYFESGWSNNEDVGSLARRYLDGPDATFRPLVEGDTARVAYHYGSYEGCIAASLLKFGPPGSFIWEQRCLDMSSLNFPSEGVLEGTPEAARRDAVLEACTSVIESAIYDESEVTTACNRLVSELLPSES